MLILSCFYVALAATLIHAPAPGLSRASRALLAAWATADAHEATAATQRRGAAAYAAQLAASRAPAPAHGFLARWTAARDAYRARMLAPKARSTSLDTERALAQLDRSGEVPEPLMALRAGTLAPAGWLAQEDPEAAPVRVQTVYQWRGQAHARLVDSGGRRVAVVPLASVRAEVA